MSGRRLVTETGGGGRDRGPEGSVCEARFQAHSGLGRLGVEPEAHLGRIVVGGVDQDRGQVT